MAIRSLNQFRALRRVLIALRNRWLERRLGASIHPGATLSLSARVIGSRGHSITVHDGTLVAFKVLLTARGGPGPDGSIMIGHNCFIGGGSTILPGVTIGDGCIIGAGSVVFDDVPDHCIAVGNPARVVQTGVEVGRFGRLPYADDNSLRMYRAESR